MNNYTYNSKNTIMSEPNTNVDKFVNIDDVSGDFSTPEGVPDGYDDLVCQFVDDTSSWTVGDGEATLTGQLLDGTPFEGTDSIKVVQ